MGCHVTSLDANELLFEDHHEDGCEIINRGEYLSLFADDSIHIDREFAGILAGHLHRWSETGSFLEPVDKAEPAEEATAKFLGGLGQEIKALAERVAALEQAKEPEPQRWGLWGHWGKLDERYDSSSPHWWDSPNPRLFETKLAANSYRNSRVRSAVFQFAVYPYPADGGPPLELRTNPKPYGLWHLKDNCWSARSPFDSAGQASAYANRNFYADWRNQWRVYPWPEDGGKPMELRAEAPKLPELWGVWFESDNRWMGSHINGDFLSFFKSESHAKRYTERFGGEPRILPIEELIRRFRLGRIRQQVRRR